MTRYLGFDIGTKTIGFAASDASAIIATPLHTLKRSKFSKDVIIIKALIDERNITDCVLGLPLNMDGTEGPRCQATRAFARNLMQYVDCKLHFWDERMSSVAVERTMLQADLSRAKRAEHVDKLAASYILQGFLDANRDKESTY